VPNFAKVWQDEVRRLARKETKDELVSMRQENAALKKYVASLKKRLETLERQSKRIQKHVAVATPDAVAAATPEDGESGPRLRVSGKTVRTLRQRLGVTQAEFATLLGVTGQSVYQWERRDDRIRLRNATMQAFAEIKGIGAREARRRLEALAG
jgi:DNA-binding transcriptional regulator YiaG